MIVKKLLIALAMLSLVSAQGAESNELQLFVNTEKSFLWRTSESSTPTIEWDAPEGAVSATLSVRNMKGEQIIDVSNLSEFQLNLETPSSPDTENVYDLTLTFNFGESNIVRRGQIGVVTGMGDATAAANVRNATNGWNIIKDHCAVLPIPAGAATLSIDGVAVAASLDGAAGWYAWKSIKPKQNDDPYALSLLFADNEEWAASILSIANGLALIIK